MSERKKPVAHKRVVNGKTITAGKGTHYREELSTNDRLKNLGNNSKYKDPENDGPSDPRMSIASNFATSIGSGIIGAFGVSIVASIPVMLGATTIAPVIPFLAVGYGLYKTFKTIISNNTYNGAIELGFSMEESNEFSKNKTPYFKIEEEMLKRKEQEKEAELEANYKQFLKNDMSFQADINHQLDRLDKLEQKLAEERDLPSSQDSKKETEYDKRLKEIQAESDERRKKREMKWEEDDKEYEIAYQGFVKNSPIYGRDPKTLTKKEIKDFENGCNQIRANRLAKLKLSSED